jgi:hypothetical protein
VVPRRREFPGFRFLLNSFRNIGVQLQSESFDGLAARVQEQSSFDGAEKLLQGAL